MARFWHFLLMKEFLARFWAEIYRVWFSGVGRLMYLLYATSVSLIAWEQAWLNKGLLAGGVEKVRMWYVCPNPEDNYLCNALSTHRGVSILETITIPWEIRIVHPQVFPPLNRRCPLQWTVVNFTFTVGVNWRGKAYFTISVPIFGAVEVWYRYFVCLTSCHWQQTLSWVIVSQFILVYISSHESSSQFILIHSTLDLPD